MTGVLSGKFSSFVLFDCTSFKKKKDLDLEEKKENPETSINLVLSGLNYISTI